MEYHNPDDRWDVFGCKNYQEYLSKYLVKGRFHKNVPKDVLDAFETIEYLQAHAYYYWPMYDEAVSKGLRTIEMAVKLRCEQLNISLQYFDFRKNKDVDKDFSRLIQDVVKAERSKKQANILEFSRILRNIFMHPKANSFAGGIGMHNLIHFVNAINILFAEEAKVKKIKEQTLQHQNLLNSFGNKLLSFEIGSKAYYIHKMRVLETFLNNDIELTSILIEPIIVFNPELKKDYQFAQPITYEIECINFLNSKMEAVDHNTKEEVIVTECLDERVINLNSEYQNHLMSRKSIITETEYDLFIGNEIERVQRNFKYKYYKLL